MPSHSVEISILLKINGAQLQLEAEAGAAKLELDVLSSQLFSWSNKCKIVDICKMQFESLISFGPKYFIKMMTHCEKMWFKTVIFCSKVPPKCTKWRFRDVNFKKFTGCMPPDPHTIVWSLLQVGPRNFFCALWHILLLNWTLHSSD